MRSDYRNVVFLDLDNTLLEGPFERIVFPVVITEISTKSGADKALIWREIVNENHFRQSSDFVDPVLAMDWDDIFKTVAKRLGITLEASARDLVVAHSVPPYSTLLENAKSTLQTLANSNRAVVAATKGLKKYQLPILEGLDIANLFTEILTPDTNHALKQDIRFYGEWSKFRLRISIGDHYQDDVVAPKRFGFKSIWKLRKFDPSISGFNPADRTKHFDYATDQLTIPDAIIFDLAELPHLVTEYETLLDN